MLKQHCLGILSMLSKHVWDNIAQENCMRNVGSKRTNILSQKNRLFQICLVAWFRVLYHWTILALFVQCWLGSSFTACGTTMNRGRLWLEQYHRFRSFILHWILWERSKGNTFHLFGLQGSSSAAFRSSLYEWEWVSEWAGECSCMCVYVCVSVHGCMWKLYLFSEKLTKNCKTTKAKSTHNKGHNNLNQNLKYIRSSQSFS